MLWTEATIEVKPDLADVIGAELIALGVNGFQIEDDGADKRFLDENADKWDYVDGGLFRDIRECAYIKFYIPEDETHRLTEIERSLSAVYNDFRLTSRTVDDAGWIDGWKKHYKPFKLDGGLVVRPVWEDYPAKDGETVLTINPGHLFGTGLHQTTAMCAGMITRLVRNKPGAAVADIGCGSGILGIAALLFGACSVMSCDIEEGAPAVVTENAALNGFGSDRLRVLSGDILHDERLRSEYEQAGKFDFVCANIVADVIIALRETAKSLLKPGGVFVVSGIIDTRRGEVMEKLTESGYNIKELIEKDGWCCMAAELPL